MPKQKILLPHNFSDYDHRALDFIIRTFANSSDVEITVFNTYTPLPEISNHVHEAPVLEKLKTNLNHLSRQITEQKEALNKIKQDLLQKGFSDDHVRCLFIPRSKDTASEIINLSKSEHFDMIVLNHKPGKISRFFTGSLYQKVVGALKETAVCIIT
jgi:hypothetical protein